MVIDNMAELLDDQNINNEIYYKACILLSNVTVNHLEESRLFIFKPNNEVAIRIKEYFISHDVDKESSLRIDKLLQLRGPEMLK